MELKWNRRRCGIHCESSLNRTFMELKFGWSACRIEPLHSLNRTFMELKLLIMLYALQPQPVKSHLYGIEIENAWFESCFRNCLNRTFMELKLSCMYLSSASAKLFKSHLYGIEISYGLRMLCHLLDFFIAPLWNNDDLYSTWYCGGWRPPLLIGS